MMREYGEAFYAFLDTFALSSARRVVPVVLAATRARTIADFGCGRGAWLSVWREAGLDVLGIDGPYVDMSRLLIDPACFMSADLAAPIDLGRRFDLVQSLETAEHLPAAHAAGFVASLVAHADRVLFSAAVPGQGGEHHVNERPLEYWRGLFRAHDYVAVDVVRPALRGDAGVRIWYHCNTILYVKQAAIPSLGEAARIQVVPEEAPLPDYWPWRNRLAHGVVRRIPLGLIDRLSSARARLRHMVG